MSSITNPDNILSHAKDVRTKIRDYLKANHIAQLRLAEALLLTPGQISQVLNCKRPLTPTNLSKINLELGTNFTDDTAGPKLEMGATG